MENYIESDNEKRYKVKERCLNIIKDKGSPEKALVFLKAELKSFEDLWGLYSSDCLGHGITFNNLAINFINKQILKQS